MRVVDRHTYFCLVIARALTEPIFKALLTSIGICLYTGIISPNYKVPAVCGWSLCRTDSGHLFPRLRNRRPSYGQLEVRHQSLLRVWQSKARSNEAKRIIGALESGYRRCPEHRYIVIESHKQFQAQNLNSHSQ